MVARRPRGWVGRLYDLTRGLDQTGAQKSHAKGIFFCGNRLRSQIPQRHCGEGRGASQKQQGYSHLDKEQPQLPQIPGYTTESVLGKGGMATVYLAVQKSLSRHVALKVMKQVLVADEDFCRRFLNEGRLIAQLSHPNIVTVHDIGTADGIHYLAMTYLPGGTLLNKIRDGLPLGQTIEIMRSLTDALAYAHRQGIIHRDIKPGNILFTHSGKPVLTDFGIAKSLGSETQLTSTGMAMGSVKYMSPEQALGEAVDNRSDLYSLGVLFWLMLTGEFPYHATDPFALALKHAKDPIPILPGHLDRFQSIIERLLAKQPPDRVPSAEALIEALESISYSDIEQQVPASPGSTVVMPAPSAPTHTASLTGPGPDAETIAYQHESELPERRARRWPVLAALAAAIGIAGYVLHTGPLSPSREAQDQPSHPAPASSPDPNRAAPPLSTPAPIAEPDAPVAETDGTGQRIEALLQQAQEQWKHGRLTEPSGDNAFETYRSILELDPDRPQVRQKLVEIGRINAAKKMFLAADHLLREGEIDDARRMIETGLRMNPDDKRLLGLRHALE